jgi:hypothetical protein
MYIKIVSTFKTNNNTGFISVGGMMKRWLVLFLFFISGCLFNQTLFSLDGFSAALGAEINGNSRESFAAGGNLAFGLELNQHFTAGLKIAFNHNFNETGDLEAGGLFRYYLPTLFNISGFFAQAEIGTSILFEDGQSYPAFLIGIGAGYRFFPAEKFFVEPAFRFGYPFIWGIGISAGLRFDIK